MNIAKYIKLLYLLLFALGIAASMLVGAVRFINILNSTKQKEYTKLLSENADKAKQYEAGKRFLDGANEELKAITPFRIETRGLQNEIEQIFSLNDTLSKKTLGFSPFLIQIQNIKNGGELDESNCVNYATLNLKITPQDILAQSPAEGSVVAADIAKMVLTVGLNQKLKIKDSKISVDKDSASMRITLAGEGK